MSKLMIAVLNKKPLSRVALFIFGFVGVKGLFASLLILCRCAGLD